jgi:hypothetical protein
MDRPTRSRILNSQYGRPPHCGTTHDSHPDRIAAAQDDLIVTDLDLSIASRPAMALAIERLRSAVADLIRSEREHHPDA